MRRWNEAEYDVLFRAHSPVKPKAPDLGASRAIARTIGRTPAAVIAQWNDARSAVLGSSTAASGPLIDYLRARRWL
jgi:hypothetical protein